MVRAPEDNGEDHPYWYACVLGIYHANVGHRHASSYCTRTLRVNFLWVRWLTLDPSHRFGLSARRLPRLGFLKPEHAGQFGFLDPQHVVRAVHLIPAFTWGMTGNYLSRPSPLARSENSPDEEWCYYYLNWSVCVFNNAYCLLT